MGESSSSSASDAARFQRIDARAPDADAAERALAEALAAGARGAEEREEERGIMLCVYLPAGCAAAVAAALAAVLGTEAIGAPEPVEDVDWSEQWKRELRPIEISPRLLLRPSFERAPPRAGQRAIAIDPGQAFGTGAHESTRLALEWIDALHEELTPVSRVLDVGTGSGVLALGALALGAGRALAFDLDPLAAPEARANARRNGLESGLELFTGSADALAPGARFDGIVANLLRRELEPWLGRLAGHLAPSAWLVVSGLLADERVALSEGAAAAGLRCAGERHARDPSGVDWIAWLMRR